MLTALLTLSIVVPTTVPIAPVSPSEGLDALEATSAADTEQSSGEIVAHISGIRSQKGQIFVVVFDQSKGFPGKRELAVRKVFRRVQGDRMTLRFADLPPGEYAIAFIHDENGNRHLDRNFIGLPKEGLGVSNAKGVGLRIPTFTRAKFSFDGVRHVERMRVQYL